MNELKPGPIKTALQVVYESLDILLHRPFLQYVLTQLHTSVFSDINTIPSNISSRAHKAIDRGIKHVSNVRTLPLTDWFMLKQVLVATLLVTSASRLMGENAVPEREVMNTLNAATEIFARGAQISESARRALQLISEIRVSTETSH